MDIVFLYFRDCPSHETALKWLKDVLEEVGRNEIIRVVEVRSEAQAHELRFPGSPTIRINGRDIAPLPEDVVFGLSCRAYHRPDGRISPQPPVELIRTAVLMGDGFHSSVDGEPAG